MVKLCGIGVSKGIAIGKILLANQAQHKITRRIITDIDSEIEKFTAACAVAQKQLEKLFTTAIEKVGKENASVFEVHSMIISDTDFTDPIIEFIKLEKVCAEFAVKKSGEELAESFADLDDDYMSGRAADIIDITQRIINILLCSEQDKPQITEPSILISDDFTPSETAVLERSLTLALVSAKGTKNAHAAIFARTMGIPAAIGFGNELLTHAANLNGKTACLNGETGELYIEPCEEILALFLAEQKKLENEKTILQQFFGKSTLTKNEKKIKLYANIGSCADTDAALKGDAEGIGLFRTEFLFLSCNTYPPEDLQFESYRKAALAMKNKEVIIRTLDIGADKQAKYFDLPNEANPALGMRAIRICLTRPELFKTQLRAIYRASAFGNISIMFPMISSLEELEKAKFYAKEVRDELQEKQIAFNKDTPIGIMIETPASVIISDILAKHADFFSIGTNDLTQYTLAIDRENETLKDFINPHHEAILRMIEQTCNNAHKENIPCGICGTLAGDFALTKMFLEIGIDELSVEPSCVLNLRRHISTL